MLRCLQWRTLSRRQSSAESSDYIEFMSLVFVSKNARMEVRDEREMSATKAFVDLMEGENPSN